MCFQLQSFFTLLDVFFFNIFDNNMISKLTNVGSLFGAGRVFIQTKERNSGPPITGKVAPCD